MNHQGELKDTHRVYDADEEHFCKRYKAINKCICIYTHQLTHMHWHGGEKLVLGLKCWAVGASISSISYMLGFNPN